MGHLNEVDLKCLAKAGKIHGMNIKENAKLLQCVICKSEKQAANAFKSSMVEMSKQTLEIVQSHKIKMLQTDNGTEYRNKGFDEYLNKHGIGRRLTVPHTPQQNGFRSEYQEFYDEPENGVDIPLGDQLDETERSSSSDEDDTEEVFQRERRGRGRPKLMRTGQRGRPRKIYQQGRNVSADEHIDQQNELDSAEDIFEGCEMAFAVGKNDPATIKEAQGSGDAENWTRAMEDEFMAQILNKTWEIVERPKGRKVIGNKMVLQTKDNGTPTG
ncbi:uncharacterized protein LOC124460994 [Drosophila willistoni]|uniref:uncharacterized protein LOC124460994 n=1 Tax=Drosophila willistoni TaxID=7260 RepID=UPI001F08321F|nr:uncharacterized protein LOC124460994 [Drosophila willistoni]